MTDLALQTVPIDAIKGPGLELRQDLDDEDLQELAASIARLGLIHPPRLVRLGDAYRVIAGHRRVRACRLLGWKEIPATVGDHDPDQEAETGLVENLHRRDLNPVEEAEAFASLIAHHGYTPRHLAKRIGRSLDYVEARGRLLDWPADVRQAVRDGKLTVAAARPLADVDDPAHRAYLLTWAITQGASASLTNAWLHDYQMGRAAAEARGGAYPVPGSTTPPPEATLQCAFCGEWKNLRDVEHLRACSKCRAQMYGSSHDAAG